MTGGERIPLSGAAGGSYGNDVKLPNDWRVEVKRFKTGEKTLYGWILDERERPDAVAFRADNMPWVVAMHAGKFNRLLEIEMAARELLDETVDGLPDPAAFDEFITAARRLYKAISPEAAKDEGEQVVL
jgi:hypothetical protein